MLLHPPHDRERIRAICLAVMGRDTRRLKWRREWTSAWAPSSIAAWHPIPPCASASGGLQKDAGGTWLPQSLRHGEGAGAKTLRRR